MQLGLKDVVGPRIRVLLVGINPGLRSALVGHHFAGPSNPFWRLLFESRLIPERLSYQDDVRMPEWGFALTNIVPRPTSGSSELTRAEFEHGAPVLLRKLVRLRPEIVAPIGVSVWRALIAHSSAPETARAPVTLGLQRATLGGARVYVLPNPSGRNAHVSYERMLAAFTGLRALMDDAPPPATRR